MSSLALVSEYIIIVLTLCYNSRIVRTINKSKKKNVAFWPLEHYRRFCV